MTDLNAGVSGTIVGLTVCHVKKSSFHLCRSQMFSVRVSSIMSISTRAFTLSARANRTGF